LPTKISAKTIFHNRPELPFSNEYTMLGLRKMKNDIKPQN